jgi:hypothetical protein
LIVLIDKTDGHCKNYFALCEIILYFSGLSFIPVPAIYVIDSTGLVQFNYVDPNFKVRLHEELLLKAASLIK